MAFFIIFMIYILIFWSQKCWFIELNLPLGSDVVCERLAKKQVYTFLCKKNVVVAAAADDVLVFLCLSFSSCCNYGGLHTVPSLFPKCGFLKFIDIGYVTYLEFRSCIFNVEHLYMSKFDKWWWNFIQIAFWTHFLLIFR